MIVWLQGPSGGGKSTLAPLLAQALKVPSVDLDDEIERQTGRTILDIFSESSEDVFRALEWNALVDIVSRIPQGGVVALGGGAVTQGPIRSLCRSTGIRLFLDVSEEEAITRILSSGTPRPLIFEEDPAAAWRRLYRRRLPYYRDADERIDSSGSREDVLERSLDSVRNLVSPLWEETIPGASTSSYSIHGYVSPYICMRRMRELVGDRMVGCVTESRIIETLGDLVAGDAGSDRILMLVEGGEGCKSLSTIDECVGTLSNRGMTRDGLIISVGGGVVTDIGGFLASVYMRGIASMHVPTTMTGIVDASIGGKNAVNAAGIRNLVGTIRHAEHVWIASGFLHTLPARELRSGYVEVLKMAIAHSEGLWQLALEGRSSILAGELPHTIDEIIRLSIQTKLHVVAIDPFDQRERLSLNLGHTFGHAIEAALPGHVNHGEAVALGIIAASCFARESGRISRDRMDQVVDLMQPFTPAAIPPLSPGELTRAMSSDKKGIRSGRRIIVPVEHTGYAVMTVSDDASLTRAIEVAVDIANAYHS